jgi:hypothetical protein
MISKQVVIAVLTDNVKSYAPFASLDFRQHSAGDVEFSKSDGDSVLSLYWRLLDKSDGFEIDQLSARISFTPLENFIGPLATNFGLKSSGVTLRNSPNSNRELFLSVCSTRIKDDNTLNEVSANLIKYLGIEVIEFFNSLKTLAGLGGFIQTKNFADLINIGIGDEYPVNIFKAITIAHWCSNSLKYEEFKKGLSGWFEEDKRDPNYAKVFPSFERAFSALVANLENG